MAIADLNYEDVFSRFLGSEDLSYNPFAGFINKISLGKVDDQPVCLLRTSAVGPSYDNYVSGKDAVEKIKPKMEGQNIAFLYPENYKDFTFDKKGGNCFLRLFIMAENASDMVKALEKVPGIAVKNIARFLQEDDDIVSGDYIQKCDAAIAYVG